MMLKICLICKQKFGCYTKFGHKDRECQSCIWDKVCPLPHLVRDASHGLCQKCYDEYRIKRMFSRLKK